MFVYEGEGGRENNWRLTSLFHLERFTFRVMKNPQSRSCLPKECLDSVPVRFTRKVKPMVPNDCTWKEVSISPMLLLKMLHMYIWNCLRLHLDSLSISGLVLLPPCYLRPVWLKTPAIVPSTSKIHCWMWSKSAVLRALIKLWWWLVVTNMLLRPHVVSPHHQNQHQCWEMLH